MPATVSLAADSLMSTPKTSAPWRASSVAVARPLPHPGPMEPIPETNATFPSIRSIRPASRSGGGGLTSEATPDTST